MREEMLNNFIACPLFYMAVNWLVLMIVHIKQ